MFKYGKCLCVYAFVWGRGGYLILGMMRKSNVDSDSEAYSDSAFNNKNTKN
jgi:hypothetical protein